MEGLQRGKLPSDQEERLLTQIISYTAETSRSAPQTKPLRHTGDEGNEAAILSQNCTKRPDADEAVSAGVPSSARQGRGVCSMPCSPAGSSLPCPVATLFPLQKESEKLKCETSEEKTWQECHASVSAVLKGLLLLVLSCMDLLPR